MTEPKPDETQQQRDAQEKAEWRKWMDQRLEDNGLLDYQTKGLSPAEIAARYAKAGITINGDSQWFRRTYGFEPPDYLTDRTKMEQYTRNPGGYPVPVPGGGNPLLSKQSFQALRAQAQPTTTRPAIGGTTAQRPSAGLIETRVDPVTGRLYSANAGGAFATLDEVKMGRATWADLSPDDTKTILGNPTFYQSGEIRNYSWRDQQMIIQDPSFDWTQLPKWQRIFYGISSQPMIAGAIQGLALGAGNPGGALVGAGLGGLASVSGYDPTKEFWEQGDGQPGLKSAAGDVVRTGFGLMNWFAEQAEKAMGTTAQVAAYAADPNREVEDLFANFELTWQSSANFFETFLPALGEGFNMRQWIQSGRYDKFAYSLLAGGLYATYKIGELVLNPDAYLGQEFYIGAANPIPLDNTWLERIEKAREEIANGKDYREVMMDLQAGVMAQIADIAGQGLFDPLNLAGETQVKVGERIATASGDTIAAAAFRQSLGQEGDVVRFNQAGLGDARRRVQQILNTPGAAQRIDPNFRLDQMGWITRTWSGLTSTGQVRAGILGSNTGLLDYRPRKPGLLGYLNYLREMTPEARAREGQSLVLRNLGGVMSAYFKGVDVEGYAKWWSAFRKGDMTQAAELSTALMGTPEMYTVLPAAAAFDIEPKLAQWKASEPARMAITRLANLLGENPMTLMENLNRSGMAQQDLARIRQRLTGMNDPDARALVAEIDGGTFTADMLASAAKVFADGETPFHPGQWFAQVLDDTKKHYDEWAIQHFKLDEEARKTLFRMSSTLKSMQSILLLGGNPGYFLQNVLNTTVTRAFDGVWGYLTGDAIDKFMDRMGYSLDEGFAPPRLDEAVGPAELRTPDAIRSATRGKGWLTSAQRVLEAIGRKMPFNSLSRIMEGREGRMAYTIGMMQYMGENWRRERMIRAIPPQLATELNRVMGPRGADLLMAAVEGARNVDELNAILTGAGRISARSLIDEAAKNMNVPVARAAQMLEQMGILEQLDAALKGANNEARIRAAYERAKRNAKAKLDEQAARDAVANIEHTATRLEIEGSRAVTDLLIDMEQQGMEQWLQHYERMAAAAEGMDTLKDATLRDNLWRTKYAESQAEYRRFNAHRASVYLGVVKALGLENNTNARTMLATMADTDRTMAGAYQRMSDLRDNFFRTWNGDWDNPRRRAEQVRMDAEIERIWAEATRTELDNSRKMGDLLGKQYDELFGVEAGEAARQAWEKITAFRQEMTQRRDTFRRQVKSLKYAQRVLASREFWGKTYKYMIVEMERIRTDAIKRLDEIIRRKRGGEPLPETEPPAPTPPTMPPQPAAAAPEAPAPQPTPARGRGRGVVFADDPVAAQLRADHQERMRRNAGAIDGVWEMAGRYGFDRGILQDGYRLLATLKKAEYGGDPNFTGGILEAAQKWTPEEVEAILRRRVEAKETAEAQRVQERNARPKHQVTDNDDILTAIKKHGGIDSKHAADMLGEATPQGAARFIFSKNGRWRWALDEMARQLSDDGFPIELGRPDDPDGTIQTTDLVRRALAGEPVYTRAGAEARFDKAEPDIARAYAESVEEQVVKHNAELEAASKQWVADVLAAAKMRDFDRLAELGGQIPEGLEGEWVPPTAETYAEFWSRLYDEASAADISETQRNAIAENIARSERAIRDQRRAAETGMTRTQFRESLTKVFLLDDTQADAIVELTDARARASGDEDGWYRTHIANVLRDAENADLNQRVWHGSPFKFDKFTMDHIGEGEGAHSYGWGLYFADEKAVAEFYRTSIAGQPVIKRWTVGRLELFRNGEPVDYSPRTSAADEVIRATLIEQLMIDEWKFREAAEQGGMDAVRKLAHDLVAEQVESYLTDGDVEAAAVAKRYLRDAGRVTFELEEQGQVYQVDIPDDGYLLWDRPLDAQPEKIQAALRDVIADFDKNQGQHLGGNDRTGADLYHYLVARTNWNKPGFDQKAASQYLASLGIVGIKYLDQASRAEGEGTYNYVLFSADAIEILDTLYQQAWHGTAAKGIERFSTDFIGTGEGAQAFGWGLYFTEEQRIAEQYRRANVKRKYPVHDLLQRLQDARHEDFMDRHAKPADKLPEADRLALTRKIEQLEEAFRQARDNYDRDRTILFDGKETYSSGDFPGEELGFQDVFYYMNFYNDPVALRKMYEGYLANVENSRKYRDSITGYESTENAAARFKAAIEFLDKHKIEVLPERKGGQVYQVEIPDTGYLLWDRPIKEQPEVMHLIDGAGLLPDWVSDNATGSELYNAIVAMKRKDFAWGGSERAASLALRDAGVPGIKYLDGQSRMAGEGTYNYVIFEESAVRITDTLYQAAPLPRDPELIAVHNLSAAKLAHADRLGGLAMPSLAVIKRGLDFEGYGEITLLADKRMVTPGRDVTVGNADLYTPRWPTVKYELDVKALADWLKPVVDEIAQMFPTDKKPDLAAELWNLRSNFEDNGRLPEYAMYGDTGISGALALAFMREKGITPPKGFTGKPDGARPRSLPDWLLAGEHAEAYRAWLQEKSAAFTKRSRIFKGHRYDGTRMYRPYTLENVVADMKARMKEGEGYNYGVGSVRSKIAKRFRTLDGIRRAAGQLVDAAADMTDVKQGFQDRMWALYEEAAQYNKRPVDNQFGELDRFANIMAEVAEGRRGIASIFKDYYGDDLTPELRGKIAQYLRDLREAPTKYFEAKAKRAVRLNEFAIAIVPKGASAQTRHTLEANGLRIVEYDPEVAGDRQRVVQQAATEGGLLFQESPSQRTDTPAFRKWFGKSKVLDANGRPLVVYHGTSAEVEFTTFKKGHNDIGIHFGTATQANERLAYLGAMRFDTRDWQRLMPVYLRIENPLRLEDAGAWDADNMIYQLQETGIFAKDDLSRIYRKALADDMAGANADLLALLKRHGYDGIVYRNTGEVAGSEALRKAAEQYRAENFPPSWKNKSSFTPADQKKPYYIEWRRLEDEYTRFREEHGTDSYAVFDPEQIKSAYNEGGWSRKSANILQQGRNKGGIRFLADGKAIIKAFEGADVTTVVHEVGHIFRRDLGGADLNTVERWVDTEARRINAKIEAGQELSAYEQMVSGGQKIADLDGVWQRGHEEIFARAFERYLADGSAPTPRLKVVFEKLKAWIVSVYRAITGSPIDVEITPEVREVFDRLLTTAEDPVALRHDPTRRIERIKADAPLAQRRPFRADPNVKAPPAGTPDHAMTFAEYKASLLEKQQASGAPVTAKPGELDADLFGDVRERWMATVEKALLDGQDVPAAVKQEYYGMKQDAEVAAKLPPELFQEADPANIWIYKLIEVLEGAPQKIMTVEQLKGIILKSGVKADELYWTGFSDWLETLPPGTKVKVEDALAHVQKLELDEYLLRERTGDDPVVDDEVVLNDWETDDIDNDYLNDLVEEQRDYREHQDAYLREANLDEDDIEFDTDEDYADFIRERIQEEYYSDPENKAQHTTAEIAGESFQVSRDEIAGTTTITHRGRTVFDGRYIDDEEIIGIVREEAGQRGLISDEEDGFQQWGPGTEYEIVLPGGDAGTYEELLITVFAHDKDGRIAGTFKTGHWSQDNVLAHTRFDLRDADDGKKVLFIHEIQSDWHQAGREQGYNDPALRAQHDAIIKELDDQIGQFTNPWGGDLKGSHIAATYTRFRDIFVRTGQQVNGGYYSVEFFRVAKEKLPMLEKLRKIGDKIDALTPDWHDGRVDNTAKLRKLQKEYQDTMMGLAPGGTTHQSVATIQLPEGKKAGTEYDLVFWGGEEKYPPDLVDAIKKTHSTLTGSAERLAKIGWGPIAPAPFAKTWPTLVMKRLIRYAAENGIERIAFPTGPIAAQIEGHRLLSFDAIRWNEAQDVIEGGIMRYPNTPAPTPDDVIPPTMEWKRQKMDAEHGLKDYIGDDAARQIREQEPDAEGWRTIETKDIVWGGEKMRWFYDRNLVNDTNALLKRWGGRVVDSGVALASNHRRSISENAALDILDKGRTAWYGKDEPSDMIYEFGRKPGESSEEAVERVKKLGATWWVEIVKDNATVHSFDLTPEMVESAMAGQYLFQKKASDPVLPGADPNMPTGAYEEAAEFIPHGRAMDELWSQEINPLLDGMQDAAIRRLKEPALEGGYRDLSPEGQRLLQQWMGGTRNDMAATKMGAARWGQVKRDQSLLNYNRRYGFDQMLDITHPYQFFYTRSMMTWAGRALDNPAWLANYARWRRQQERYENNQPERLRGKIKVEAPWLPEWMGGSVYIDPLSMLFTPHALLRPVERMMQDTNQQLAEAERVLQEWAQTGRVPADQLADAAQTHQGSVWEQALAEAQIRREAEISNPLDFVNATLGPAWYLTTPARLLGISRKGPETISELPLTRTARAVEAVSEGTWAEPAGKLIGLLAKPEEWARKKLNLPQMGEYGDYYIDRMLANMVAEGLISSEDAIIAMTERQGDLFEQARQRVEQELAMRVPMASGLYALLHGGPVQALKALPSSLFGASLLPEGELKYRGLKDEWDAAWRMSDAGDEEAVNRFFEAHPEYEAYLAKGKEPEERLRSFLVGQVWDGYMALGTTDRKQAQAEMGTEFTNAFLNTETRNYETIDINTLAQWAIMLRKPVPKVEATSQAVAADQQIDWYNPQVTAITDKYFDQRKALYPDYYDLERQYFALPKSERRAFLVANPQLKAYWDWKKGWYDRYPGLVPIFNGQAFKRIDTSTWNPMLVEALQMYVMLGYPLGTGAWSALEQQWILEGQPRGSVQDWLEIDVAPAITYQ